MRRIVSLIMASTLCGCALGQSGSQLRTVASTSDVALSADYRMVFKRGRNDGRVLCAEPSPDIGRIVSAASSGNLTGSAKGLEKVQPELALAFAASRAEGLAQLGQRLATIQLLRDSTFRACEAYANGAIGASTYAMIVSRYDDVMVTLLLGEMAAGAMRPASTALLAGSASTAGLSQQAGEEATKLTLGRMGKATAVLDASIASRAQLKADASDADKVAAEQAVAAAQKEFSDASSLLKAALSAVGGTNASTAPSEGSVGQQAAAGVVVAQQLGEMQKRYLDDFNLDAVTVGCLSALSQLDWPERARTTAALGDAAAPTAKRVPLPAETGAPRAAASEEIPEEQGVPGSPDPAGYLSSKGQGAYSLQDECRAILLQGRTLRAVARERLEQIRAQRGK